MATTPAAAVSHTSRRVVSAIASIAVAATILRFGIEHARRRKAAEQAAERQDTVVLPLDRTARSG